MNGFGCSGLAVQVKVDLLEPLLFDGLTISSWIDDDLLHPMEYFSHVLADVIEAELSDVAPEQSEDLLSKVGEGILSLLFKVALFEHLDLAQVRSWIEQRSQLEELKLHSAQET